MIKNCDTMRNWQQKCQTKSRNHSTPSSNKKLKSRKGRAKDTKNSRGLCWNKNVGPWKRLNEYVVEYTDWYSDSEVFWWKQIDNTRAGNLE